MVKASALSQIFKGIDLDLLMNLMGPSFNLPSEVRNSLRFQQTNYFSCVCDPLY